MNQYIKMLEKIREDLGYLKLGGYLRKGDMASVIEDTLSSIAAVLSEDEDVNPDYIKLAKVAYDTVYQTMIDGEAKHGDEWLSKSIDHHKEHALGHAELNYVGDKSDKHTNNCLTRNAMILYLEAEQAGKKMKYRKKPVVIEAVQWTGLNLQEIKDFVGDKLKYEIYDAARQVGVAPPAVDMKIDTLEGEHIASKGDYIIKGIKGEFYPCKPDIFAKTYELVED
jgi:hypothetical protein